MSKRKIKKKDYNDKNYNQYGKTGWCLKEKVPCYGNCSECTLQRFPELEKEIEEERLAKEEKRKEYYARKEAEASEEY